MIISLFTIIACNLTCEAGYTLNVTTCTCALSKILQLSPSQNEGNIKHAQYDMP